jgi:hypothetical protein
MTTPNTSTPPEIKTITQFCYRLELITGGIPEQPRIFNTHYEAFKFALDMEPKDNANVPTKISRVWGVGNDESETVWEATNALLDGPREALFASIREASTATEV